MNTNNKLIKIALSIVLMLTFLFKSHAAAEGTCGDIIIGEPVAGSSSKLVEKKKHFSYEYELTDKQGVEIENHFGDVKFKYWEKSSVQFDITVVANAKSDEKAKAFINSVKIEATQSEDHVSLKTQMSCQKLKYSDNVGSQDDPNYLKVNYIIFLPKGHPIKLKNSHGDIYMPDNLAEVNIEQQHGILYASHLSNPGNYINIKYGKAYIKSLEGGSLSANKMEIVIDNAKDISLANTFGAIKVNNAENVDFKGKYTSGYIGTMKQSCKLKIDYSDDFALGQVNENITNLELETSYSNVHFPMCREAKFNMTVEAENSEMDVAYEQAAKALGCKKNKNVQKTVEVGTAGEVASNIVILANHGSVRIK